MPLMVKIGLKTSNNRREHDYPAFNQLAADLRGNTDWSIFVDQYGGWHYDKEAGHADHDPKDVGDTRFDSPHGMWLGMLLVPENFAQAAVKRFPEQCYIIDDKGAEEFYEARCTAKQPEVHDDVEALQALAAKKQLGMADDDPEIAHAMDVDHPSPGRRRNKLKTWEGYKKQRGVTIKADL